MNALIQKYNIAGPRYTSYPTVPYWDKEGIALEQWKATVKRSFDESNEKEGTNAPMPQFFKTCDVNSLSLVSRIKVV